MRLPGKAGCANPSDGEPEYPGVPSIIEAMDDARSELLLQARSQALSLPDRIPKELRLQVVKAAESRGTKQSKVKLNSMDVVAVLLELA